MLLFAMFSGIRQGEHWNLELRDVRLDGPEPKITVRFGSKGKTTKSGKRREVPLIPRAVEVLRAWLKVLPEYSKENKFGLVFPTPRGCRRQKGKIPKAWKQFIALAKFGRNVRWHDLRHTCGSSLAAGWWGGAWRLEEIRDLLGHSSVKVTEMYAHLAPSVLSAAAAATTEQPPVQDSAAKSEPAVATPATVPLAQVTTRTITSGRRPEARRSRSPRSAHTQRPTNHNPAFLQGRARQDSNLRPPDSKSDALSS